jgi:NAD(P)H-dependent FMN reductase
MERKPKILAFAGSARRESWNKKLLRIAVTATGEAGGEITLIELADYPLPFYNGDLEAESGVPDNAVKLREIMFNHDGFLIASPEYNGSVSALLKNTLDWCSRPAGGEEGLASYRGKITGLMAASPGPFGGIRGLSHLRAIMGKMGATVLGDDIAVPFAHKAFDSEGVLTDAGARGLLKGFCSNLVTSTAKHIR